MSSTDAAARDEGRVRDMFDRIAPRYDRANALLSFGRDRSWRRRAAAAAAPPRGGAALDVACGTGTLTRELSRLTGREGRAVGLDVSDAMLVIARAAAPSLEWVHCDATALPFAAGSFDAATIAFGLRNLAHPSEALGEMARVVRPRGRVVVLEFLRPSRGPVGRVYGLYLRHILPHLGAWLAGDAAAYRYLSDTVASYLSGDELIELCERSGWVQPQLRRLTFGAVGLLTATVR